MLLDACCVPFYLVLDNDHCEKMFLIDALVCDDVYRASVNVFKRSVLPSKLSIKSGPVFCDRTVLSPALKVSH